MIARMSTTMSLACFVRMNKQQRHHTSVVFVLQKLCRNIFTMKMRHVLEYISLIDIFVKLQPGELQYAERGEFPKAEGMPRTLASRGSYPTETQYADVSGM